MKEFHYLYFKNGDAVDQVTRVLGSAGIPISSGPDAFIWDFFRQVSDSAVTVLSRSQRRARIHFGSIEAQVFDKGKGLLGRVLRAPLIFLQVLFCALHRRPTHVLCGTTGSMFWACMIVAWIRSVPLVYSGHNRLNFNGDRLYRRLAANLDRWCIGRADAVICHGPYLRDQLLQIGIKKQRLFEFDVGFEDMLVDVQKPLGERYVTAVHGYEVILFVGRIEQDKGVFDLLNACAERLLRDQKLRLVYAGTGSQTDRLTAEIARRGLKERVILFGMVPHQELAPLMRRCRIMVTPTRGEFPEGRCMAAMEGMVMGLPVIAPDFGPFPYIVTHNKNGMLYRTGSMEDLKQNIASLLDDSLFYERIKTGAETSGMAMVHPPLTFGAAAMSAFAVSNNLSSSKKQDNQNGIC